MIYIAYINICYITLPGIYFIELTNEYIDDDIADKLAKKFYLKI